MTLIKSPTARNATSAFQGGIPAYSAHGVGSLEGEHPDTDGHHEEHEAAPDGVYDTQYRQ